MPKLHLTHLDIQPADFARMKLTSEEKELQRADPREALCGLPLQGSPSLGLMLFHPGSGGEAACSFVALRLPPSHLARENNHQR